MSAQAREDLAPHSALRTPNSRSTPAPAHTSPAAVVRTTHARPHNRHARRPRPSHVAHHTAAQNTPQEAPGRSQSRHLLSRRHRPSDPTPQPASHLAPHRALRGPNRHLPARTTHSSTPAVVPDPNTSPHNSHTRRPRRSHVAHSRAAQHNPHKAHNTSQSRNLLSRRHPDPSTIPNTRACLAPQTTRRRPHRRLASTPSNPAAVAARHLANIPTHNSHAHGTSGREIRNNHSAQHRLVRAEHRPRRPNKLPRCHRHQARRTNAGFHLAAQRRVSPPDRPLTPGATHAPPNAEVLAPKTPTHHSHAHTTRRPKVALQHRRHHHVHVGRER
mmetsp:Transcript_11819/g.27150  ORF Transcript_11819/g.27150 Transcript_11819/m.27150 type:complete len:330 (-) Transcript_11819:382-1371(-)